MIADISILEKSFGSKLLYDKLRFSIQAGEKVGLVGRNGVGKSTLLGLMDGSDRDFSGEVIYRKGVSIISTRQEHHGFEKTSVLEYILGDLPEYAALKHKIDTLPATMGDDMRQLHIYSEALERFGALGYYTVEDLILRELDNFQIDEAKARGPLGNLSGGQKRLAEVVKVMHAHADLALIDEPTNHMDYVAKAQFIEWLNGSPLAMLIVTHDRDVLGQVDRIIEIKDGTAHSYAGNYDQYLRQNAVATSSSLNDYEVVQRRITNLKADVIRFRRLKEKARNPPTIQQFKRLERQAEEELAELLQKEKPTFWIDRESAENLDYRVEASYQKHKTKNIRLMGIERGESASSRLLIDVKNLSLGYNNQPLFSNLTFQLRENERLELRGRNGAGKTTLIKTILAAAAGEKPETQLAGSLVIQPRIGIGVYEQEVSPRYFGLTLFDAIERLYLDRGLSIGTEKTMQLMSSYLFNPHEDGRIPLAQLSGGQKARFQLISMLANNPQLLILDEPTNHLDLPSIEELENALGTYNGAIIYVSHDAYFTKKLPATTIGVGR
ncbi:MAG TPA: ABC-F family ATP-binding cassette domain-containing protein [Candidatus Acidoferrum sp.]|nr:ABC-F family ATP-binding cassette domain-containing protein [Candidatus Acidoferrum sp.]